MSAPTLLTCGVCYGKLGPADPPHRLDKCVAELRAANTRLTSEMESERQQVTDAREQLYETTEAHNDLVAENTSFRSAVRRFVDAFRQQMPGLGLALRPRCADALTIVRRVEALVDALDAAVPPEGQPAQAPGGDVTTSDKDSEGGQLK